MISHSGVASALPLCVARLQIGPLPANAQELDSKSRLVAELTLSLQREERSRAAAHKEAGALRAHLQAMERELSTAQASAKTMPQVAGSVHQTLEV